MSDGLLSGEPGDLCFEDDRAIRAAIKVQRNRTLAVRVAQMLRLPRIEADVFVQQIVTLGMREGDAAVRNTVIARLDSVDRSVSDAQLELCMHGLMVDAWQSLKERVAVLATDTRHLPGLTILSAAAARTPAAREMI